MLGMSSLLLGPYLLRLVVTGRRHLYMRPKELKTAHEVAKALAFRS